MIKHAMGWIRDLPDFRDYNEETPMVQALIGSARAPIATAATVDLRKWCSPIEDQKSLGSCTANAAVGILEYYERRAFGTSLDASRLFVYKTTRNLLGWKGDQERIFGQQ